MNSKTCGHTYSREAILSLLNGQSSVKCPIAGCSKTVSANKLEPDEDMIWLLVIVFRFFLSLGSARFLIYFCVIVFWHIIMNVFVQSVNQLRSNAIQTVESNELIDNLHTFLGIQKVFVVYNDFYE